MITIILTMSLETWCSSGNIWSQLSFLGYLRVGGRIHIAGLSTDNLDRIFQSLKRQSQVHTVWNPTRIYGDYILLGKDPDINKNILFWRDNQLVNLEGETLIYEILSTASPSITPQTKLLPTKDRPWQERFYP